MSDTNTTLAILAEGWHAYQTELSAVTAIMAVRPAIHLACIGLRAPDL